MPVLRPARVRLTMTPLGGGSSDIVEAVVRPTRSRVKSCRVSLSQSRTSERCDLVLDNTGNRFSTWTGGATVKVELQSEHEADYTTGLEGFIGRPVSEFGWRPRVEVTVYGPAAIMEVAKVASEVQYDAGMKWTDMADDLATDHLAGYTRTITTDALVSTTAVKFAKGEKLAHAFDRIRRALNAGTSSRWEWGVTWDGATKTIKLYKRDSTVIRAIRGREILPGARRDPGDVLEVVNRATVFGATAPSTVFDRTGYTKAGVQRLDATSDWAAQPFVADDSPLSAHALWLDRSLAKDPPGLQHYVARNSDNVDVIARGVLRGSVAPTLLRSQYLTVANLIDDNAATTTQSTQPNDSTYYEVAAYDLGASPPALTGWMVDFTTAVVNWGDIRVSYSTDDSSYTVADTLNLGTGTAARNIRSFASQTKRYWKFEIRRVSGSGSPTFAEWDLHKWLNLATDPAFPYSLMGEERSMNPTGTTNVATTGNIVKELARFNLAAAQAVAKFAAKHSHSSANSLVNLEVQTSPNGTDWTTLAILPSTTSTVTDTTFTEDPDVQYVRLIVRDERSGGSASITSTCQAFNLVLHTTTFNAPLIGDALKGSTATWMVENLVKRPALVEATEWPQPRVALTQGRKYWHIYVPQSGAAVDKWWEVEYATDASTPKAAQKSTDSGATWSQIAANAILRYKDEWNVHVLEATAEDSGSQTTYANLVPGGILDGSTQDESLTTQDAVDKEAAAMVAIHKAPVERVTLSIPLDLSMVKGKRVSFDDEAQDMGAPSTAMDVVDVAHDLDARVTGLQLGEHAEDGSDAIAALAGVSTGGRN